MSQLRLPASNQESKARYPLVHGRRHCRNRDLPGYERRRYAGWISHLLWLIYGFVGGRDNCRHLVENHKKLNASNFSRSLRDYQDNSDGLLFTQEYQVRAVSNQLVEIGVLACRAGSKAREFRLVLEAPN